MMTTATPGAFMAAEIAEAGPALLRAAGADHSNVGRLLPTTRSVYTVARGSSDAAANILSYEIMRTLGVPCTSLPPSVFSLGQGVDLPGALTLILSQSGASPDLVNAARGALLGGATVLALTNTKGSPVEAEASLTLPIGAGVERAVPATKSVVATIGTGVALLAALHKGYRALLRIALKGYTPPEPTELRAAFLRSQHVYVIGRDTGYGAALEVALKLKECCALHAEAYSAAEVLHGPLQLADRPLTVVLLDIGTAETKASMDAAFDRFTTAGCLTHRITAPRAISEVPGLAAAWLLLAVYPAILETALALGFDPDSPAQLKKVTATQ